MNDSHHGLNYESLTDRAIRAKEAAWQKKQMSLPEVGFWLVMIPAAFVMIAGMLFFVSNVLFPPLNLGP